MRGVRGRRPCRRYGCASPPSSHWTASSSRAGRSGCPPSRRRLARPPPPSAWRLSAGSIATMTISGALCRRLGSRNVTVAAGAALSLTLVLPAFARSAVQLGLALAVFGVAYGALNVAMNSVAVDVVAALRRPVMPSFHAAWSFGGLAGASVGGLLAPHLAPRPGLAVIAVLGLVVTILAARTLLAPAVAQALILRPAGGDAQPLPSPAITEAPLGGTGGRRGGEAPLGGTA